MIQELEDLANAQPLPSAPQWEIVFEAGYREVESVVSALLASHIRLLQNRLSLISNEGDGWVSWQVYEPEPDQNLRRIFAGTTIMRINVSALGERGGMFDSEMLIDLHFQRPSTYENLLRASRSAQRR